MVSVAGFKSWPTLAISYILIINDRGEEGYAMAEFESRPIQIPFFQEKVTHSYQSDQFSATF